MGLVEVAFVVDFRQMKAERKQQRIIDPVEIFRRLPKGQGINDLYTSQAEVLNAWFARRTEKDTVLKLHTGGGKTLVGLLIAQSAMTEMQEPVVYLAPTLQLVEQTVAKAHEYSIPAVAYGKGAQELPQDFFACKSVLVCTYQALFNGMSRFGIRGSGRDIVRAGTIILDDAHVAFSTVRDAFTLRVEKDEDPVAYSTLCTMFRNDFMLLGKSGTFDDIVAGSDFSVLEVPYWSWQTHSGEVRSYLRSRQDEHKFTWPFLRDHFDYCHALISKSAFTLTPLMPFVDMLPTFAECPRRVFMSATISDDSAIVRTFNADAKSIAKPIASKSLAGVSERMILAPELMPIADPERAVRNLVDQAKGRVGSVVLVPSAAAAQLWNSVGTVADSTERVKEYVDTLVSGDYSRAFVFANRYDGIDLPGTACRLLVMAGLPKGMSEYDLYRGNVLEGGVAINSTLAQRIEQGMGRGARGAGDWCVVVICGKDLVSWISRASNLKLLTTSTRAQLQMGWEISKNVSDEAEFIETIRKCTQRDRDWIEYHADTLAELTDSSTEDAQSSPHLEASGAERKALKLFRDGYFDKAISVLERCCEDTKGLDDQSIGWLKQLAARIAHYWGNLEFSLRLQQAAYSRNSQLLRPRVVEAHILLGAPGKQAESIASRVAQYHLRRGFLAEFDSTVSQLTKDASSNQFEDALMKLGNMLGFAANRPETASGEGPDVLWLLDESTGLVVEAKSHKKEKNALTKGDFGQLLVAVEWFKKNYPGYRYVPTSIHPVAKATKAVVTDELRALTFDSLNALVSDARILFTELCNSTLPKDQLVHRCEQLLATSSLRPDQFTSKYLVPFERV